MSARAGRSSAGSPDLASRRSALSHRGQSSITSHTSVSLGSTAASVCVPAWLLSALLVAATVDGTTGLLTSTAWRAQAYEQLAVIDSGGGMWGLLVVDLDRFGELNERYGHPAVDHVLAHVGRALRAAAGPGTVVGRFGGDEFVILATVRTEEGLRRIGENVRQAVAAMVVDIEGSDAPTGRIQIVGVTASVGAALHQSVAPVVATLEHADGGIADPLTVALWAADNAVYRAKRAGGNVVCTADAYRSW